MGNNGDENRDGLDTVGSLPADDSTEQEVESLWRQLMVYKTFSGSELADAKANRVVPHATRQQSEIEAVWSTKDVTDRMRQQAQEQITESNDLKEQAARDYGQAQAELTRSIKSREQAEAQARADVILTEAGKQAEAQLSDAQTQAETVVAQAEENGRQLVDAARGKAQQETTELKRQALQEIRSVMTHIQEMGAAASEELETQRILTNIAQIRTSTRRVLEEATDHAADDGATLPEAEEESAGPPASESGDEQSDSVEQVDEPPAGQNQSEGDPSPRTARRRAKKHVSA